MAQDSQARLVSGLHLSTTPCLSFIMDYDAASLRLLPNTSIPDNYSFVNDVMDNPTSSLSWVLLIKQIVPNLMMGSLGSMKKGV